eukprot:scaffold10488_cov67-Cyclotella_meneghiniana.AAC.5
MALNDSHEYWGKKGRLIGENSSIDTMELSFTWESAIGIISERFRISQDSILRSSYDELLPTLKLVETECFPA